MRQDHVARPAELELLPRRWVLAQEVRAGNRRYQTAHLGTGLRGMHHAERGVRSFGAKAPALDRPRALREVVFGKTLAAVDGAIPQKSGSFAQHGSLD